MSRRTVVLSVAAAVAVVGGAGAFALVHAGERQSLSQAHGTARYTAPDGDRDGSLVFTTDVTAPSGVTGVRVLAWPADSSFAGQEPTAEDLAAAEPAKCLPSGEETVRCVYTVPVTRTDAEGSPRGVWHVAVLASAADGSTQVDAKAADFTVG
ncbi:DUF5707 domain-containing protein [Streptomyces sp. PSRA5]|uniref:DUF5707 domain-containing protein n=1 Tax=Streptomyces panacea TaxID=3035064 RepID=UPI00339C69E0